MLPARAFPPKIRHLPVSVGGSIARFLLVAGVPGRKLRVLHYQFVADGTVTMTVESGTTAISGDIPFTSGAVREGGTSAESQAGVFETRVDGEDLNLSLDSIQRVEGSIVVLEI